MLSLHREQEADSVYTYEVEKLDLPPGLPPSFQLWGLSGVRADTLLELCWSQPLSPLSLAG